MSVSGGVDYVLTIVQHTFCKDCVWLKNKITDVYHASGMVRGQESQYWRVQILSPPWDRARRAREFPKGFATVEVPALKLEINGKLIFATQEPALVNELLARLKWMLINRETNAGIADQLRKISEEWVHTPGGAACPIEPEGAGTRPEHRIRPG